MNKLEEARKLIDEADTQIREGFQKRMQAVVEVINYKKEHQLPILDSQREKEVIAKNLAKLDDVKLAKYYEELLNDLMQISKAYQEDLLHE